MKQKDFETVLTKAFDKKLSKDATKGGKNFVKYFSFNDAETEVFLGGTCNNSKWRDEIIQHLDKAKVSYFNPVVKDWNDAAKKAEEEAKLRCGIHLYVVTPKMTGVFSIAEAVKSAVINPKGTVFVICIKDGEDAFTMGQIKSLEATGDMIVELGGRVHMVDNEKNLIKVAEELGKIKRGFASTLVIQMQSHPIKYGGIHGIQVYDLICLCRGIIQFFNDKFGSAFNMETIKHLKKAKEAQEARTADRKERKVEGYDKS